MKLDGNTAKGSQSPHNFWNDFAKTDLPVLTVQKHSNFKRRMECHVLQIAMTYTFAHTINQRAHVFEHRMCTFLIINLGTDLR